MIFKYYHIRYGGSSTKDSLHHLLQKFNGTLFDFFSAGIPVASDDNNKNEIL